MVALIVLLYKRNLYMKNMAKYDTIGRVTSRSSTVVVVEASMVV